MLKTFTIALASSSITRWDILRLQHNNSPSLSPHNSASKLLVSPIRLLKPLTHWPLSSRTMPPQPANLASPLKAPSVLNFFQPNDGLSQHILLTTLPTCTLGEATQCRNSKAWFTISAANFGLLFFQLKTSLFLLFQIFHTAKGKTIFQGGFAAIKLPLFVPFDASQTCKLLRQNQKAWSVAVTPSWFHTCLI